MLSARKTVSRSIRTVCCNGNRLFSSTQAGGSATSTLIEDEKTMMTGIGPVPISTKLEIVNTKNFPVWPSYRVMDLQGKLLPDSKDFQTTKEQCQEMYRVMARLQALDDVLYNAQRQGRISFYMQNSGEEGTQIGSASSLTLDDVIFSQYREAGVLLWRGFTVQQAADQCFSNEMDLGRGRQMPVHYGTKELNFQTVSSPLTTQLPQAVGCAYALKAAKKDAVAVCYFGEGAASEGDFHAALNFASTLNVPVIFVCRNNGYAISTPTADQFAGDGIISRAAGYGMHAIRVDGNDIFAMQRATAEAKRLALQLSKPVLIEAMSYRRGHHSTSDDSTRYRSVSEIKHWEDHSDPMHRLRRFMGDRGWWDDELDRKTKEEERAAVLTALEVAEKRPKPPVEHLFTDVYHEKPAHLQRQEQELLEHMKKYPEHYSDSHH